MAVLQQSADADTKKQIVAEILQSVRHLKYMYMLPVSNLLAQLVPHDNDTLSAIYRQQRNSYRRAMWEKYLPAVIILITMLLCAMMYWYSHR